MCLRTDAEQVIVLTFGRAPGKCAFKSAGGVIEGQVIEMITQPLTADDLRADEAEAAWAVDALHLLPGSTIALEQGRRGGESQFVVVHEQVSALAARLDVKRV